MSRQDGIDALVARIVAGGGHAAVAFEQLERLLLERHGQADADAFVGPLQALCAARPESASAWCLLGLALHDVQRHEEALPAVERAVALRPDPRSLLALAQLCYETGRPAAERYRVLQAAAPGDLRAVAGLAGALAAEGQPRAAEQVLLQALAQAPAWLQGQQRLASLRQTSGWPGFDAGYAEAVQREPGNAGLWMGWFTELAKARQWESARAVLRAAVDQLGQRPAWEAASLYLDAESGLADHRPDLFDGLPPGKDPGIGLARVRHALRTGRPDAAARHALPFLGSPAAPMFWPYLSLAWRLLGDRRAEWLDRPDAFIQTVQLDLGAGELEQLAALLRGLHTMAAPYLEQSVRGGTQTDRPLLFRHEPAIQRLRAAIEKAARVYVDGLPAPEPGHPLLGPARERLRFAGSWSVRLGRQGFHACHTHPMGWISSACYIALPEHPGPSPAGCLRLGTPPPELGLALEPYCTIVPQPGQLVLFPSTLWHGTVPFDDGERLTVAFDLRALAPSAS